MGIEWTKEQKKVIELRDRNILVSAAAGSGKTAVLVERIIQKITDKDHPVDIDRMLVVTFTKAAAAEMKTRIEREISKLASLNPSDGNLQRQRIYIHRANITTIDSFCRDVLQNNFQDADLDPQFRVGDAGELKLIKQEAVSEVLEEYYEEKSSEFLAFVETFARGKKDEILEELIFSLYDFSMSHPWPVKWLKQCIVDYDTSTEEEMLECTWMKTLNAYADMLFSNLKEKTEYVQGLAYMEDGPNMYLDSIQDLLQELELLCSNKDYRKRQELLENYSHLPLSRKKADNVSPELRVLVKNYFNSITKQLAVLREGVFFQPYKESVKDIHALSAVMKMLVELTISFLEKFSQKKRKKKLVDFNDLEHEALRVLVDEDEKPTKAAEEYAQYFDEIMIDEYQDSNKVQELLLTSVSKLSMGIHNIFMVGDAKQSIYSFRMANPKLFIEKNATYSLSDSECQRVDLHNNFRSRGEVLSSANYIFERLMKQDMGGIEYDNREALFTGADYPAPENEDDYLTELHMFDAAEIKEKLDIPKDDFEGELIADRIHKLVHPKTGLLVTDKRTGEYRRAEYKDIVILLRSMKGSGENLAKVLRAAEVPVHVVSSEGYFDAQEVVTLLNVLRIIDNPLQDIPLASVMVSPIGNFSDEELAFIKSGHRKDNLYQAVCTYIQTGEEESLRQKLSKFVEMFELFRKKEIYLATHELLWLVLDTTGYAEYISATPSGKQKLANVEMLVEKAVEFEKTSYLGLFQFVCYIEKLQKYSIDFGEMSILSEKDNTVRIMSIHKSKGLEFPIVIVGGVGKMFNTADSQKTLLMNQDLGIATDCFDIKLRRKSKSLMKESVSIYNKMERMGEELRILYVALTRAKEKLILVGGMSYLKKTIADRASCDMRDMVPFLEKFQARNYLQWIISAVVQHKDFKPIFPQLDIFSSSGFCKDDYQSGFLVKYHDGNDLLSQVVEEDIMQFMEQKERKRLLEYTDRKLPEEITKAFLFNYPYEKEVNMVTKYSVSELKKAGDALEEEETRQFFEEPVLIPLVPSFLQEQKEISPVKRGTAYHKILECLDYDRTETLEQITKQIEKLVERHILEEEAALLVRPEKIFKFASSKLGRRMKAAAEKGKLYREQPFVLGLEAGEIKKNIDSSQIVLVQGIIDAFFEEDGGYVIVDYKTDRISEQEINLLAERYKVQLDYYGQALERIKNYTVKEKVIYSVELDKELAV